MTRRNTHIIISCGIKRIVISAAIWPQLWLSSQLNHGLSLFREKFLILLLVSRWSRKDIKTCLEQKFCLALAIVGPSLGIISGSVSLRQGQVPAMAIVAGPIRCDRRSLAFPYISRQDGKTQSPFETSSFRKIYARVTMSHFTRCHA